MPVLIGNADRGAVIDSLRHVVGNVNGNNTGNAWHLLIKCADQPNSLSKILGITEAGLAGPRLVGAPNASANFLPTTNEVAVAGKEPEAISTISRVRMTAAA